MLSTTVGVPNSLGPGELLVHYGTEAQKDYWLPRLARGEEIPCFALTSPTVGSDAASISDTGIVCRGTYEGREVLGLRLNFSKRYITLAPVATVIGLAFRMFDPDRLLGGEADIGITCALLPREHAGHHDRPAAFPAEHPVPERADPGPGRVRAARRHHRRSRAGRARLAHADRAALGRAAASRCRRSRPAARRRAVWATGAYARIRRQFGLPVGKFEGVEQVIARMLGTTYIMDAARSVTTGAIDGGERPAVPAAILKYHVTEMGRAVGNDAMDVHGGKGVMLGPRNYLARGYQAAPIGITVEGANILTRNLIIFGQGAIRCHPFVLKEMQAARSPEGERSVDRVRSRAVRPHRLRDLQRGAFAGDGAHVRAFRERAGHRRREALLPAHRALLGVVRFRHRRRDAVARRLPEEEGEPVGAAGRRALATCTSRRWC